jgi:hypothetical protein
MGTKRRALRREHRPPVSAEALQIWRRCRELERQGAAGSAEYGDLAKKLCGLVGLFWGTMQWPTDCKSATLPAYLRGRELQTVDYWAAYRARLALIEAEDREAEAENEQRPGPTT